MPSSSEITTALAAIRSAQDLKYLSAWELLTALMALVADGGGAGGGSGTSADTIASGINQAADIDTIAERLDRLPPRATTANTPSIGTGTTALAASPSRQSFTIQNLGTDKLYIRLGANASITVFHAILVGDTAQDSGGGGQYYNNEWTGEVTVAGVNPRYVVTEIVRA